jgi:hypothetical protein
MRNRFVALAVAGLALSAAHSAFAQIAKPGGQAMRVIHHPRCANKDAFFPIAEAYPATSSNFTTQPAGITCAIQGNRVFCGAENNLAGADNTKAAPGALALCSVNLSSSDPRQRLNVNAFATCPTDFGSPFVQSYRLIKKVSPSQKCPVTFQSAEYTQFGGGVRTWWTLIYTSPGTTFTLEVTVRCIGNPGTANQGEIEIHIDRWVWQVIVTFESLEAVIDVLHSNTLGTSEIPCIASEDMYLALKQSVARIRSDFNAGRTSGAQDKVFEMEALVIAFCAFGDCFVAEDFFNTLPPSNDMQNGAFGWTGVLDTIENPCCCKLLVDIEKLAIQYGIVTT